MAALLQKPDFRIEGKDGLAKKLHSLKDSFGDDPQSIWLVFDWDKTLKLPFQADVKGDLPADAPQWKTNLAKDLRGGAATMKALEQSPFQKFIVTAKPPQLGNPATGLVTEAGSTLRDPIFLRMHKCFSMESHDGSTIKYTTPEGETIEYTEDQTLLADCWDKVPRNKLTAPNTVTNDVEVVYKFAQNFYDDKDSKWKFHSDVESTAFAPLNGKSCPVNGGTHYFPHDSDYDGTMLKRVGNAYSSGYEKPAAVAKAVQIAHQKNQPLPSRIVFFDDNVDNAWMVDAMAGQKIKEVVPDANIQVEGIFWDPFVEEIAGDAALSSYTGSDFQLDGVIAYPNFRDDHLGAIKNIKPEKLKHLEFYGLQMDDLLKRFETYLPLWEKDAADKGIKLGQVQGEAAKSAEELKAEEEARRSEIDKAQQARAQELGLEETEVYDVSQKETLAALDVGPKKTGIAKIPDFQLSKAKESRLKRKAEIDGFLEGGLTYEELSEEAKKGFDQGAGEAGATAYLGELVRELDEIEARLKPKPKGDKGKAKGKEKGKCEAIDASSLADKGKGKVGKVGKSSG